MIFCTSNTLLLWIMMKSKVKCLQTQILMIRQTSISLGCYSEYEKNAMDLKFHRKKETKTACLSIGLRFIHKNIIYSNS